MFTLEFNVSRPYPRLLSLALLLYGLASLVILVIINVPLAGYDNVQFTTRDWLVEDPHWWDPIIPSVIRSRQRLCQPAKIGIGTKFRTDYNIFDWEITKMMQRSGEITRRQPMGFATGWTTSAVNGTLEYKNNPLDMCDVYAMFIKVNVIENSVAIMTDVFCDNPLPFVARATWKSGVEPFNFQTVLDSSYYEQDLLNGAEGTPFRPAIVGSLQILGLGLALQFAFLYNSSTTTYPVYSGTYVLNRDWCPLSLIGKDAVCPEGSSTPAVFRYGQENGVFINGIGSQSGNGSILTEEPAADTYFYIPSLNESTYALLNTMLSAVRADFGGIRGNNLFQNLDLVDQQIQMSPLEVGYEQAIGFSPSTNAKNLLKDTAESKLPISGEYLQPSRMVINYLCTRKELKSPATLIFNVAAAALALFGGVWTVANLIATMLLTRRPNWQGATGNCLGHANQYAMTAPGLADPKASSFPFQSPDSMLSYQPVTSYQPVANYSPFTTKA